VAIGKLLDCQDNSRRDSVHPIEWMSRDRIVGPNQTKPSRYVNFHQVIKAVD